MLRKILIDADAEGTGTVTWPQISKLMRSPTTLAHFRRLDLEPWDLHTFFDLLQQDFDEGPLPEVEIDSFIRTCMRFKGMAKNVEVVALRHEQEISTNLLGAIAHDLSFLLQQQQEQHQEKSRAPSPSP